MIGSAATAVESQSETEVILERGRKALTCLRYWITAYKWEMDKWQKALDDLTNAELQSGYTSTVLEKLYAVAREAQDDLWDATRRFNQARSLLLDVHHNDDEKAIALRLNEAVLNLEEKVAILYQD